MRILHITNVDQVGGTNTNCLQFINASSASNTLFVLDEPGEMEVRWGRTAIDVRYLNILKGNRIKFVQRLESAVGKEDYDIVLLWCCIRIPLIRYALRRVKGKLGIHLGNPKGEGRWRDVLLYVQAFVLRSRVRTKLFSCSSHVRASYEKGFWARFDNQVIYNPIKASEVPITNESFSRCTPPRIGMVARMDQIKDYSTLVRALKIVRDKGTKFQAEFVGDGPIRAEIEDLVDKLDLRSSIKLAGSVDDVFGYLQSWSLFVYSTTEHEGLGNSLVEALAFGVPCLASDLPMMREIDANQSLINFFRAGDPDDCAAGIIEALLDEGLRKRLSERGRQHVLARHNPAQYHSKVTNYLMN